MISILVPIYNGEKYIQNNIETLLNQKYKNIEIICINDGSTDGTQKILNKIAGMDSRVIVINKKNSGYGHSMNTGLSYATGKYIAIMEGDDFVSSDMLGTLRDLSEEHDCDIVKSDWYYYFDSQKKEIKANQVDNNIVTNIFDDFSPLLIQASIWSCLYRREFLLNENIKFLETPGASYQDTSFSFKCFATSRKSLLTEQAFVRYRLDNEQSSVNSSSKVWEITKEYKEIEKFLNERNLQNSSLITPYLVNMFKGYNWNLSRIKDDYKKEFLKYFSSTFKKYKDLNLLNDEFFKYIDKHLFEKIIKEE